MSNEINAEDEFPVGTWVHVDDFPIGEDMKVVRVLEDGWRGVRYRSSPTKLEYGEFHIDELSVSEDQKGQSNSDEPASNTDALTIFP